jgi:hypothetical protein
VQGFNPAACRAASGRHIGHGTINRLGRLRLMAFLLQPRSARFDPPGLILDATEAALQRVLRLAAERPALGLPGPKRNPK